MMQSDTQVDQFLVRVEISLLLQPSALGSRRKHRRKTWFCDCHQTFRCSSGDQKHPPGKAPNERVLGHETFGPLIQLTEGLQTPSFSWLLFPFQPCTQETELQFKPKDHKSSCKCNSSHHCQMVQKRRRRRFLSTTDNTFKCMMLFFISRLHYRTWIHNCPVFSILSQLSSLNSRICCVQN
jgi:hypothetical protein